MPRYEIWFQNSHIMLIITAIDAQSARNKFSRAIRIKEHSKKRLEL